MMTVVNWVFLCFLLLIFKLIMQITIEYIMVFHIYSEGEVLKTCNFKRGLNGIVIAIYWQAYAHQLYSIRKRNAI